MSDWLAFLGVLAIVASVHALPRALQVARAADLRDRTPPIGACAACGGVILRGEPLVARAPASSADYLPGARLLSHARCRV